MWTPPYNTMDDAELRAMVLEVGSAELVTVDDRGYPVATRLPVIWEDDRLRFHLAVANPHWRSITDGAPALAVITGPEAYITPTWYAAKREHGRVVPTWNYSAIHFTGTVTVHQDPAWLLAAVSDLSDQHEQRRDAPWSVDDAPESFISQQLRAIVGVELAIENIGARAKRSQNRPLEDREAIIEGLRTDGGFRENALAEQMEHDLG